MQHLFVLIGISGSGKSTFAKEFVQTNPSYLRLNRDNLRRSLLPISLNEYWQWNNRRKEPIERMVTQLEKVALTTALNEGWNVLLDNTHLRQRTLDELLMQVENRRVTVTFKTFDVGVDEAIRRDAARPDVVGEAVIREQFRRYQQLKRTFDTTRTLVFPRAAGTLPGSSDKQPGTLPRCILVDIDGTVALIGNRSPFEWKKVYMDRPRTSVINVIKAMQSAGYAVIFLSGRDSICQAETIAWLYQHIGWQEGLEYSLFMRRANDNRKDAVIKRELFDTHIRNRYAVEVVFDDRDQVVSLWRHDLGLTCLQVDYGNF
ncbi:phosphatase domain-containing protein [Fibrella aquatica]|uniref:phosphatase domain-containing protein n=1 Tax=Fibrella aquatica TaxID=3242487 RepID=UPI003522ABAB